MKIRSDFVTNSSSSSFVTFGVLSQELAAFIESILGKTDYCYLTKNRNLGNMKITDNIVSIISELELHSYFYVNYKIEDDCDTRDDYEKETDNQIAKTPSNLIEILRYYLSDLSSEQEKHLQKIVEEIFDDNRVLCRVYVDSTDSFDDEPYTPESFLLNSFSISENGNLEEYTENSSSPETITLPGRISTISEGAFRNCVRTKEIIVWSSRSATKGSFADCQSLEKLDLTYGGYVVYEGICRNCKGLREVKLPEELYRIEKNAFAGCENLESINLPDTLLYVDKTAFDGCTKLKEKHPEIIERAMKLSDRQAFDNYINETVSYIKSNGNVKFTFDNYHYASLVQKKEEVDLWHSVYDRYFSDTFDFSQNDVIYSDFLDNYYCNLQYIDMSEIGWQRVDNITRKVKCFIVQTDMIPGLDRFTRKQEAIRANDQTALSHIGSSRLDKIIELKEKGNDIKIIALERLYEILGKDKFGKLQDKNASSYYKKYYIKYRPELNTENKNEKHWAEKYMKYTSTRGVVSFENKRFVFDIGNRNDDVIKDVIRHGGMYRDKVTPLTDFLIVEPKKAVSEKTAAAAAFIDKGYNTKIILLDELKLKLRDYRGGQKTNKSLDKNAEKGFSLSDKIAIKDVRKYEIDGKKITVKYSYKSIFNHIISRINNFGIKNYDIYTPEDAADLYKGRISFEEASPLSAETARKKYIDFLKVCLIYTREEYHKKAYEMLPKKKDGTLASGRVCHLAWNEISVNGNFYELCAVSTGADSFELELRSTASHRTTIAPFADAEKCEAVLSSDNIFDFAKNSDGENRVLDFSCKDNEKTGFSKYEGMLTKYVKGQGKNGLPSDAVVFAYDSFFDEMAASGGVYSASVDGYCLWALLVAYFSRKDIPAFTLQERLEAESLVINQIMWENLGVDITRFLSENKESITDKLISLIRKIDIQKNKAEIREMTDVLSEGYPENSALLEKIIENIFGGGAEK